MKEAAKPGVLPCACEMESTEETLERLPCEYVNQTPAELEAEGWQSFDTVDSGCPSARLMSKDKVEWLKIMKDVDIAVSAAPGYLNGQVRVYMRPRKCAPS